MLAEGERGRHTPSPDFWVPLGPDAWVPPHFLTRPPPGRRRRPPAPARRGRPRLPPVPTPSRCLRRRGAAARPGRPEGGDGAGAGSPGRSRTQSAGRLPGSGPRRPAERGPAMGRQTEGPRPAGGWLWLAAAILSSCFLLTQAQRIRIIAEPSQPEEGGVITLTPEGTADFIVCVWYRGKDVEPGRILTYNPAKPEQKNGPGFTGRETAGPGCTLHITALMVNDTGNYIVSKITLTGASESGSAYVDILGSGTSVVKKGVTSVMLFGAWAGVVLLGVLL